MISKLSNSDNSDLKDKVETMYNNIKFDGYLGRDFDGDWSYQSFDSNGSKVWTGNFPTYQTTFNKAGLH
jgi:hypothetical protein